jgi:hypothetical protein
VPAATTPHCDPVAVLATALERLAPAVVRAATSGRPVAVAVPDEATAAIFRAALATTQRRRGTDRLIKVIVETTGGSSPPAEA